MIQTLYLQLHHHVAHQAELELLVAHLPVTISVAHVEPFLHLEITVNELFSQETSSTIANVRSFISLSISKTMKQL